MLRYRLELGTFFCMCTVQYLFCTLLFQSQTSIYWSRSGNLGLYVVFSYKIFCWANAVGTLLLMVRVLSVLKQNPYSVYFTRGLGDRLSQLEHLLIDAKKKVAEQQDLAAAFLQNQASVWFCSPC